MTNLSDISSADNLRQEQALLEFSNAILQRISTAAPLAEVLNFIACGIEPIEPEMRCSVLLLDQSGQHLLYGAAPSLPREYNTAIDGIEIGPSVGSCGTAAYRGEAVFVADIACDPLWANFKGLALDVAWPLAINGAQGRCWYFFAGRQSQEVSSIARRHVETAGWPA
jgi:hypothetical protein